MAITTITLPIRMQRELYFKVKAAADDDTRSYSNWVVVLIEKEIARIEKQNINKANRSK